MVAGLLRPDTGSISVFGVDALANPVAAKRMTAWISDEPMIYDKLTPFEYLEFVAGLWGIDASHAEKRAVGLLGLLGLGPHSHNAAKASPGHAAEGGARRRARACAEASSSSTNRSPGSTPAPPSRSKAVLRDHVRGGGTVIMTTHILEVAERMADRIGVIARGRLIAGGTLDELRRQAGGGSETLEDAFPDADGGRERGRGEQPGDRSRGRRMSTPGTITWFARHELRLCGVTGCR